MISRVSASVVGHGSMTAAAPLSGGFLPALPGIFCHFHQRRSMFAWCIQKIGSAGAVGMTPIEPPTHTCTESWIPSSVEVKLLKVVCPNAVGVLEAIRARSPEVPDARDTLIVRVGVTTVGRTPASHAGIACSLDCVQSQ